MNKRHTQHHVAQLKGIPFTNTPSAALARCMPLSSESDFEVFARLPNSQAPILINFIEHYKILDALVLRANELWPDDLTILIRLSMPGGLRLPKSLLEPNVLLMQDITPELDKLSRGAGYLLTIDDSFIRYQLEQGDNQIAISLTSDNNDDDRFSQFISALAQFNIGEK